jgi:galactokinase
VSGKLVARAALEEAGLSAEAAVRFAARFDELERRLERETQTTRRRYAWFVPGRIELLGKHTDYAGGRSLICAAERGFCIVSAERDDGRLSVTDAGRGRHVLIDAGQSSADTGWSTYPRTVLRRLRRNFPDANRGANVVLDNDLPSAAGLSSSSALMIAVLLPLIQVNGLESFGEWTANIRSAEDLAAYAATIENGLTFRALTGDAGVGTAGGSEDHTAILCSRPGEVGQYAFCPTRHERSIPLPPELLLAVGVSGVAARKTGGARDDYNRASERARRILDAWRAACRDYHSLAAAVASSPDAVDRLRNLLHARADGQELVDRLDQFVAESTILIPTAGDQLAAGDLDGLGTTVARSQDLAERLLGNQVAETVALARIAREEGAVAASAFGAGFGGSVWALVEQSTADAFLERWRAAYRHAHPTHTARAEFFLTRPGPAAIRLSEV